MAIYFEGYVAKQKQRGAAFLGFHDRWLQVKKDGMFYYESKPMSNEKPKGKITWPEVTWVDAKQEPDGIIVEFSFCKPGWKLRIASQSTFDALAHGISDAIADSDNMVKLVGGMQKYKKKRGQKPVEEEESL